MKKLVFVLFIFFQSTAFSQPEGIVNLIVSPIDESTINVHSIVHFLYVANYVDHEIIIENNTIDLNLCYHKTPLAKEVNVLHDNIINVTGLTGKYTLNINIFEDSEGCFITSLDNESMELTLPLEEDISLSNPSFKEKKITIYPNPTENILNFDSNSSINTIKIYDDLRRFVLEQNNPSNQLNVSNLSVGLFFVQIETENGSIIKKVLKE